MLSLYSLFPIIQNVAKGVSLHTFLKAETKVASTYEFFHRMKSVRHRDFIISLAIYTERREHTVHSD